MSSVNLLPAYARPAHPWAAIGKDVSPHRVLKGGAAVACVAVLGLGLGYVHERSVVNDRRATLTDVQTQVAAADAKAAPLRAAQAAAAAPLAAASTISSTRVAWERVLADLSRVLPKRVRLQTLTAQSPTPLAPGVSTPAPTSTASTPSTPSTTSTTGGASTFAATGVSSSHVRVALVLDRLARLPWLSDVTLVSSANGASGTGGSLSAGDTFSVTGSFNPNGGAK